MFMHDVYRVPYVPIGNSPRQASRLLLDRIGIAAKVVVENGNTGCDENSFLADRIPVDVVLANKVPVDEIQHILNTYWSLLGISSRLQGYSPALERHFNDFNGVSTSQDHVRSCLHGARIQFMLVSLLPLL